jgi:hypothetical protein
MSGCRAVNLPKAQKPVFPNRCVACGAHAPGATYRAGTNAIGWWTVALWTFGRRFTAEVPACEPCLARMRRQRWVQLAVNVVAIVIGVTVAGALLQWYEGPLKRWLMMGVALVCLLPVFVWEELVPRPFDLTAYSNTVDYEFRDSDYAIEFALLNDPAVPRTPTE